MNHHEPTYDDSTPGAADHCRRPPPQATRVHEARPDWPQLHAGQRWRIPTDPPPV
jgi:hypothetical protein